MTQKELVEKYRANLTRDYGKEPSYRDQEIWFIGTAWGIAKADTYTDAQKGKHITALFTLYEEMRGA